MASDASGSQAAAPSGGPSRFIGFRKARQTGAHSDIRVHFHAAAASCKVGKKRSAAAAAAGSGEDPIYSFDAHTVLLAERSEYFDSRVKDEWNQAAKVPTGASSNDVGVSPAKQQRLLMVYVPDDVYLPTTEAALAACVDLLYTNEIPEDTLNQATQLIKVAQLADYYQVTDECVEECARALGKLKPEQLDIPCICEALLLPDNLMSREGCKALKRTCQSRLVQLFGDVPQVITTAELRDQFVQLPYHVMKTYVALDELKTDNENSVVVLLGEWFDGTVGKAASKAQRKELSSLIRLRQLTPGFRATVLPHVVWFQADGADLAMAAAAAATLEPRDPSVWTLLKNNDIVPPAWAAAPRRGGTSSCGLRLAWQWEVSKDQLASALKEAQSNKSHCLAVLVGKSEAHFAAGYSFSVFMQLSTTNSAVEASADAAYGVDVFLGPVPGTARNRRQVQVNMDYDSKQLVCTTADVQIGPVGAARCLSRHMIHYNGRGLGSKGVIKPVRSMADLQPYLVDGKLPIRCTIQEVA